MNDEPVTNTENLPSTGETANEEIVIARFGKEEIVESSTIIFPSSDNVFLYPLTADRSYKVEIEISIVEGENSSSSVQIVGEGVKITIQRAFMRGQASGHYALPFAQTETHRYSMYVLISMIGRPEEYLYELKYNVARRPRP